MFSIDNGSISLSRGDTASFTVTATGGYTFDTDDRALFTVKDGNGEIIMERIYELDTELGNGVFLVEFANSDTDQLAPGAYNWDVRYIIGPYYNSAGKIIDGDQVITPKPALNLTILSTVGEV